MCGSHTCCLRPSSPFGLLRPSVTPRTCPAKMGILNRPGSSTPDVCCSAFFPPPCPCFFPVLRKAPCQTSSGLDSTRLEEEEDEEGE